MVVVSNRGPVSFTIDDRGDLMHKRGAGGLVSGLTPLISGGDATWIAAAMSQGDRAAAARGPIDVEGIRVQLLDIDERAYRMAYDTVCNSTLWFAHHGLWDLARRPRFDDRWSEAWDAYRSMNMAFAGAVEQTAPEGAAVLIQDYHLCLIAPRLRRSRPDLRLAHFSHTPFAGPDLMRVLPTAAARELLAGLAAHHVCGFHSPRWADAFRACCTEMGVVAPDTVVAPLAPDPLDMEAAAGSQRCVEAFDKLDDAIGDRLFIVRVDRMELSKNILRGFHAFEYMIEHDPRWRSKVAFGAYCYPSRDGLPEYLAYHQEIEGLVSRINERWGTVDWTPIMFETTDDFPRSVAALRRYDLLLVNPIRDGLNMVAMEGPLVNSRSGLVALSTNAGAFDLLAPAVRELHPYDITATAEAMALALDCAPEQRRAEATRLRQIISRRTPADWLRDQLVALG